MPPFIIAPQKQWEQKLAIWGTQIQRTPRLWVITNGELFPQKCQSYMKGCVGPAGSPGALMVTVQPTPASPAQVPTETWLWESGSTLTRCSYRIFRKLWELKVCLSVFNKWRSNSLGIKTHPEWRGGYPECLFISLSVNLLMFCYRNSNALVYGASPELARMLYASCTVLPS